MISLVVCSIDPAKFNALSQNLAEKMGGEAYEVIGIHDAKSLCEGYNRGAARAQGETIVFCHDDIEILCDDFPTKLKRAIARFDIVGVAGTDRVIGGSWGHAGPPYLFGQIGHIDEATKSFEVAIFCAGQRLYGGIQALDGVFMAVRREVLQKVQFDEEAFDGWHLYDMDFTFAAHLAGLKMGVSCEIQLLHASRGTNDEIWMKYAQRFNRKYLEHLYPMPPRDFVTGAVRVMTRQEAIEVMSPRFWDEPAVS
jgi:GT2 family glycosyltransferase